MNCAKEKKKVKIKIKTKSGISIEQWLNELYPNKNLNKEELNYDLDIQSEYRKHIPVTDNKVDLERISNLPTLQINNLNTDFDDDESVDAEPICENEDDIEIKDRHGKIIPKNSKVYAMERDFIEEKISKELQFSGEIICI